MIKISMISWPIIGGSDFWSSEIDEKARKHGTNFPIIAGLNPTLAALAILTE